MPALAALITAAIIAGAARVAVAAVGFGVITFVGADALISAALASIKSEMGAAGAAAALAGLAGIDRGISILVGACTIRISLIPLKRLMMM